ncbi:pentapeptide repeat-containing protein [uncultured Tateyamaria sp.]|uniref:pentapeptide repeat-containing protein n=1 Tax=uncultured Tateyamaria sp. TaxID=455651 RepID=UPI0026153E98|nr:pentapeptide repeat-containing protein [uncultured Tateyamaria sp.]
MKRLPLLLLCLFCLALGFGLSATFQNAALAQATRDLAPMVAAMLLAGLILVLIAIWTGYRLAQRWVRKTLGAQEHMTETEMVTGLVDHFTTPDGIDNPTPQDRRHAAMVNLGLWLARREAVQFSFNATVTVVGGLVGAATLFLLYEQNQKFDIQNERITLQTDANITQSLLIEGARRAALAGDLTELLADIRDVTDPANSHPNCLESQRSPCWIIANENAPRGARRTLRLPDPLRERVSRFLVRNTPYLLARSKGADIDFDAPLRDQFDFPTVSPERGQMLQALVSANVALSGLDFSWAQLDGADLSAADLSGASLSNADFRGAILGNVKIISSNLRAANFEDAVLFFAQLDRTFLSGANFADASLNLASLKEVNLSKANLRNTDLTDANLQGADLFQADLIDTQLTGADLTDVDASGTNLTGAWAWADDPPTGMADISRISLCVYPGDVASVTPMALDRRGKPSPCVAPDG